LRLKVTISDFLLGATEVTQEQYEAVTGSSPSVYKGPKRPVENVSWWDAIRYCNLRSAKEGLRPCYDLTTGEREMSCTGYRLPTEAEWVHSAGPTARPADLGKAGNLGDPGTKTVKVLESALQKGTMPVRSFPPNANGVFDMRGNVWEWCGDWFDVVSSPDAIRNPSGPASGLARVIRGGSFVSSTSRWSRDYRSSMDPDARGRYTGFRIARSVETPPEETTASEAFFRR
jgi:formylglycine-generating enzyme required for sulfatase activity